MIAFQKYHRNGERTNNSNGDNIVDAAIFILRGKVPKCESPFRMGDIPVCRARRDESSGIKNFSQRSWKLEKPLA